MIGEYWLPLPVRFVERVREASKGWFRFPVSLRDRSENLATSFWRAFDLHFTNVSP
jgi:hypothetical protein